MKKLYTITTEILEKYQQTPVYFADPKLVGYYDSYYGEITNSKRIKYFVEPSLDRFPIDLNGVENYVERVNSMHSENVSVSLKYEMSSSAKCGKTKVITRRGTLVYIMQIFYEKQFNDNLIVRVSRYNGDLYMVMEESENSKPCNKHHGHFYDLVFSDSPDKFPNINKPHDENIELIGIHRSVFGKYDVIYSGEIAGILSNNKVEDFENLDALNDEKFVFAKQMWDSSNLDYKYLRYWLQSYLANVKEIYIGFKNRNGIINKPLQTKLVEDIPKNRYWRPSICTGFLYEFLQNVENIMSNVNCLKTVYVFSYKEAQRSFDYEAFNGENHKTFISTEYMEYMSNK